MNPFSYPKCPAKKIQTDDGHKISSGLHLTGPHAEFAYSVFVNELKLWAEDFIIWPVGVDLPERVASAELTCDGSDPELPENPEGYRIESKLVDGLLRVTISAHNRRGLRYALVAFAENFMIGRKNIRLGHEISWPDFPVRGIVEGFYGTPWSHQDRMAMIEFLARYRFNTYMYAPKDDFYHRPKWTEPYPPELGAKLAELFAHADAHDIELVYSIAPGLTIEYSSEKDLQILKSKLSSVMQLGAKSFALLLDDINTQTIHAADKEAFPNLAEAHAYLCRKVWEHLQSELPGCKLYFCPTEYAQLAIGWVSQEYLSILGEKLPPEVEVLWTGPLVCSRIIDVNDAEFFQARLHRPPVYWDNYPVNDADMVREMHIGPYEGREAGLSGKCHGFLANPMSAVEASKIALATLSEYCWGAENYDADKAWDAALSQAVGQPADLYLKFVGRTVLKSPLRPNARTPLAEISASDVEGLRRFAQQAKQAAVYLASFIPNQKLLHDLRPWLGDLYHWAEVLEAALNKDKARVEELVKHASTEAETIGRDVKELLPELL
ncbi:MAG: hypothetical protein GX205_05710 [Firmicutes bacterium]|nr:hypothetical protein [Bacillota bacterium]